MCEQNKIEEIESNFEKMLFYQIEPNISSYSFIIEAAGKSKDAKKAEKYFDQSLQKFGWNIFTANAMIYAFAFNKMYDQAKNIFTLLKVKGFQLNCVIYQTMILAAKKKGLLKECWKLYDEL